MRQNSTEVAYGFGQLGSIHGQVELPLIPPKGMVIVAIQFLADNTPTKLESASTGSLGYGANYIDTETAGFFNFEGILLCNLTSILVFGPLKGIVLSPTVGNPKSTV